MGKTLSPAQLAQYGRQGYLCPVDALSESGAAEVRKNLEIVERRAAGNADREAALVHNSNWVVPFIDEVVRHEAIVDPVTSILGPDLLAIHVNLFIKEPKSPHFISWHQDLHYWGLDTDDEVTAWLALSPATTESGCMRFLPGSHKTIAEHRDTFAENNLLSRGQEVAVEVDERQAVSVELKPGQMSLHHGRLFHASHENASNDRRIGLAVRFIAPSVGLASNGMKMGASLIHGADNIGNFELIDRPTGEFDAAAMANLKRLRDVEKGINARGTGRL